MNKWGWVLAVLLVLASGIASAEKPSGPLSLLLTAEPVESDPGWFDLTFSATSRRDVPRLTLWVDLPPSVTLVEGDRVWTGTAVAGEPVSFSLRVKHLGEPVEIVGRAEAEFSVLSDERHGAVWSQATSLMLGGPQAGKPLPKERRALGGEAIRGIRIR
jgi:hypothetical protein